MSALRRLTATITAITWRRSTRMAITAAIRIMTTMTGIKVTIMAMAMGIGTDRITGMTEGTGTGNSRRVRLARGAPPCYCEGIT